MQYRLPLSGDTPRLPMIEAALLDADPSAIADIDLMSASLRIATQLDHDSLLDVVRGAGVAIGAGELEQLPSECCGGCGG